MPANILIAIAGAVAVFSMLTVIAGWLAVKPVHAAFLTLGLTVLEALHLPLSIQVGISLYPEDLLFAILTLACLIRLSLFGSPKMVPLAWWVIGAVQLLLFVWGHRAFGSSAGVDYRVHFYLWVAVCYFCSVEWSAAMVERVLDGWIAGASTLCTLAMFRWIYSAIDPVYAQAIMGFDTTGVRFRVLSSTSSLMIAIGFLILLFRMLSGRLPLWRRPLLPVFLLTVVVLQHRSVWVSVFVGVIGLVWAQQKEQGVLRAALAIGLLMVPVAVMFAIPDEGGGVVASIKGAADSAMSTEEGTMVARVGNWQQLLANWSGSNNVATYLVGKPYGSGFNPQESEDGQLVFDMVPHNHFVHILYRGGLIALCCTLALFYQLWTAAVTEAGKGRKYWAPCLVGVFAAFYVFFVPYWATYACGIIFGIAISYLGIGTHATPTATRHGRST